MDDFCESRFELSFHLFTLFSDLFYLFILVCLCAFRELGLEAQAALFGDGFQLDAEFLAWQGQGRAR